MLITVLGSLLALSVSEIAVRVLDLPPRPLSPLLTAAYRPSANPVIAYEYRPGYKASEEPFHSTHRGFSINSAGFRDYEYEEAKPEGTYRVVVVGNSTTAGIGVPEVDNTYPKRLEVLLNSSETTGIRYEVLNMAVGGYHTLQAIETLRVKGLKYHPDLVLVTLSVNDFSLHADGGVRAKLNETRRSEYYRLLRLSRLAFMIDHRLHASEPLDESSYIRDVLKGQTTVRAGFVLLSDLQQQHDFQALALILPAFTDAFAHYKFAAIHDQVRRAAEGLPGIGVDDLLHDFASLGAEASRFSYDGIHLNEYGHNAMAEILLPKVRRMERGHGF